MKTLKLLSVIFLGSIILTSCVAEVIVEEDVYIEPQPFVNSNTGISLDAMLHMYEVWYVNIERTKGDVEIPFLQKAFTVSFKNGIFYANNNLVGLGSNGNGFGLDVGIYDPFTVEVDISHDIDGTYTFRITQLSNNEIELYDVNSQTSYYLIGYQRNNFDYDAVFYENIHYFLQEYEVWEKVYTSELGVLNEFDNENYLKFSYFGAGDNFESSRDETGIPFGDIIYDYVGHYEIKDIINSFDKKTLTLDYGYLDNEFFELSVINDSTIELFHPTSETVYRFAGRRNIVFKKSTSQNDKKRIKKSDFMKLKK